MERSLPVIFGTGIIVAILLLALILWSFAVSPAPRQRPAAADLALQTLPPTQTPKATETAFVFVTATPVPPTLTPTPTPTSTPTSTPTPEDTATGVPVVVRSAPPRPTSTATFTPTSTPTATPIPLPYAPAGAPVPDASRACKGGYYLYGTVRDRQGRGLEKVRLSFVRQFPNPVQIADTTRTGAEAGYYEFYAGLFANEVDMTIVDDNQTALAPSVHISLSGTNCWWVLNWVRNN